jgi:uncharacterized protein (UPF0335 family)
MPSEPLNRHHNGGPLSDDDQRKLLNHVRAIEVLEEQEQDIRDDKKVRKELAKKDGFDTKILDAIVKRRKLGQGETRAADHLIRLYEDALEEEGMLPLEQTKVAIPTRRTLEEISRETHGQELGDAAPPTYESEKPLPSEQMMAAMLGKKAALPPAEDDQF